MTARKIDASSSGRNNHLSGHIFRFRPSEEPKDQLESEGDMRRSPDQTRPEFRQLRIYAIDPMVSRAGEHQATVQIRFEELELRGTDTKTKRDPVSFVGRRVEKSSSIARSA